MAEKVSKGLIVLARESRGMSQLDLANEIGMSQQNMGKIESGDIGIKEDVLEAISNITQYPISFFRQENEVYPEHLVYRKREKVAQSLLTPINAKANITRFNIQFLLDSLNPEKPDIPFIEVSEKDTPIVIAQKVRRIWKLDKPVIENMTSLLESKGILVTSFDFATERVDSRCVLTTTKQPIIIFNKTLLGDRQRFSLAYQLGHLLMHTAFKLSFDQDIAHEANLFAAEFLMPEKDIRKDFDNGITLPLLAELKHKWKASMISLLYRADDLGYLTPNQKRYLVQQFNEQKLRRREPIELDIPIEKPYLVRKLISDIKAKRKLDTKEIAFLFHLNTDEFIELYG